MRGLALIVAAGWALASPAWAQDASAPTAMPARPSMPPSWVSSLSRIQKGLTRPKSKTQEPRRRPAPRIQHPGVRHRAEDRNPEGRRSVQRRVPGTAPTHTQIDRVLDAADLPARRRCRSRRSRPGRRSRSGRRARSRAARRRSRNYRALHHAGRQRVGPRAALSRRYRPVARGSLGLGLAPL